MTDHSKIDYHLRELDIASNLNDHRRCMPAFLASDKLVLDIGCGIGQAFIASDVGYDKVFVGMDIDIISLLHGKRLCNNIQFIQGSANALPFSDSAYDLVISRVSLPYVNIPIALSEIYRVLKSDGRLWIVLHSWTMARLNLIRSIRTFSINETLSNLYTIINGLIFHMSSKVYPFPFTNRYESFQTKHGIEQALIDAGFQNLVINMSNHYVVTACK